MVRKGFFGLLFFSLISVIYAQDVDVDFLSDQQVLQYYERAREEGYEIGQIKNYATSRGMAPDQADLLVERIRKLTDRRSSGAELGSVTSLRGVNSEDGFEDFLTGDEELMDLSPYERKLFGYKVFKNPDIGFSPNFNMPTPENYILGPSDQILIEIYGTSQQSYSLIVSPDGKVSIPLIGPVSVGSLTINAARAKLRRSLSNLFQGLKGANPTVFMEMTLGNIRSIRVNVVGEVDKPGVYAVPSIASVFNVLYAAGGPTVRGTFRNISLYRGGNLVSNVDLYDFLTKGQLTGGGQLYDDDILVVSPYKKRVEVRGEVRIPGIFELKDDEDLERLLELTGGFTSRANTTSVTLERLTGEDQLIKDLKVEESEYNLQDGDRILVRESVDPLVSKVQIEGAVFNPGPYGWSDSMNIESLIEKAGGLLPEAYTEYVTLFRKTNNLSTEAIALNLEEILNSDSPYELELGDLIVIPSDYQLTETPFIQVSGEVFNPGIIPYFQGMTVNDALLLSSGIRKSAYSGLVEVVSRPESSESDFEVSSYPVSDNPYPFESESLNVELEAFDHVFIRKNPRYQEPEVITIVGEVNAPGKYVLENRNVSISDMLERSGGVTEYGFTKGAYILRRKSPSLQDQARLQIQQLRKLNDYLENDLAGGTLSEVERKALTSRIDGLTERYEKYLRNQGSISSDSLVRVNLDSLTLDQRFSYDKIAISLDEISGNNSGSVDDLILQDGDELVIPRRPQTVKISGEVLTTSTVTRYSETKSFSDYISDAGGVTREARKGRAYVMYPNGSAARTKGFLFFRNRPEIIPGSEIIVPGGRIRERFGIDRIFGLVSTTATTYFIILSVINQIDSNSNSTP